MTKDEFATINIRRGKLIDKELGSFTAAEMSRPLTVPGWREECGRRHRANLTDAERLELARLTDQVDAYLHEHFPREIPPELLALIGDGGTP